MYRSSAEQVFAQVGRIRRRAVQLLQGEGAAPPQDEGAIPDVMARLDLRLPVLAQLFGLSPLAVDLLVCLLAAEYDPIMRTLARAVQRELGRPWLELGTIAELLELPTPRVPELGRLCAAHGALRRCALLQVDEALAGDVPVVSLRVKLSQRVARYLVDDDELPDGLRLVRPQAQLSQSLVPGPAGQTALLRARRALSRGEGLVIEIIGSPGTGRRFFAEGLAGALQQPLLVADLLAVERRDLGERLAEVNREARLLGALPCLSQWDAHLPGTQAGAPDETTGAPPPVTGPRRLLPELRLFLEELGGVVLLTGEEREPLLEQHAPALCHVTVPFPSPSQRTRLLEAALLRAGGRLEDGVDLSTLVRRFALDPRRLEVAARAATERAAERQPEPAGGLVVVERDEILQACKNQLRHDLKSLAVRVTAAHRWEDLVIPEDVYNGLEEMIAYVRHGTRVYDEWGFGQRHSLNQGVSSLFAGPPGTGKTMCASVMARELDMELFRVDLSRVVSKWIGETEKNLGKVFDEAQRSNAIILFDEADALFAKRTDVKSSVDRYANLEVNFLLQRMEAFGGVTILTTNFEDTLDTAFKRRLTFRLRFEKPDATARAALWRKVFPQKARLSDDVDPDLLGQMFEMSGGNIRNAAVRAAFLAAAAARPIDMATCMLAAERESREMGLLTYSMAELEEEQSEAQRQAAPARARAGQGREGREGAAADRRSIVPVEIAERLVQMGTRPPDRDE